MDWGQSGATANEPVPDLHLAVFERINSRTRKARGKD